MTQYPQLSIQEMVHKTTQQRKLVEMQMDRSGESGGFHPDYATVLSGQKAADFYQLKESLHNIPLSRLIKAAAPELGLKIKEYLGVSSTTGIAGAAYLVPDKIYDTMFTAARCTDIVPEVANIVECPGSSLKIDLEVDGQYRPHPGAGGGEAPTETMQTEQVTITPELFRIKPEITEELIEDSQFDVIEMHLEAAGRAMGEYSTQQWLFYPIGEHTTASSFGGDGTLNTHTSGGAYMYTTDVLQSEGENAIDGFASDVVVVPPHATQYILATEATSAAHIAIDHSWVDLKGQSPVIGTLFGITWIRTMHLTSSETLSFRPKLAGLYQSHWHSIVLNKQNFSAVVRKRWLKIENYTDPVRGLIGAVVSARQAGELLYRDAGSVISWA